MLNTQLKAVIFDLDGVLVDTSIFHGRAWKKLVEDLGHTPPHDLEERVKGISRMASLKIALGDNARNYSDAELAALAEKKNHYYLSLTKTISPADLYDGVLELFADLKSAGIKIVLGSASKNAKPILDSLGITSYFDAIADGFTYKHGKPHPDVFLTGASMVDAKPWECIVVEDASAGITAALDGGFATVAMGNYTSLKHAHLYVKSLRDLSASRLGDLQARYRSDLWTVAREAVFGGREPSVQTIFSIGNGLLGIRGDLATLSAEKPSDASMPSFLDVRFTLDGQRVKFSAGKLKSLRRTLDLRSGIFTAEALWQAPDGNELRLVERRLADMANLEHVFVQYELEAMNFSGPVTIEAGINTAATFDMGGLPQCMHKVTKKQPVGPKGCAVEAAGKPDGTTVAIASAITVHDRPDATYQVREEPAGIYVAAKTQLQQGQLLYIERCEVISDSRAADPLAHVLAELTASQATTLGQARIESTARWQELWNASDVVIESNPEDQLATRFNTFAKTALPWMLGNKDYTLRPGEACSG